MPCRRSSPFAALLRAPRMGSSFAPCVDIGRTHDGPVRSRTYAARLPRPDAPVLVTISASTAPTPRTAFSTSASFKPPSASKHGWAAPSANELGMTCTPNLPSTICNESWDFTPPSRRGDADTRRASKRFEVRRVQRPGAAEPCSGESIANSKDEPVFTIPALSSSSADTTYPVPSTRTLLGSKP
jgi:hypothetical protein